MNNRKIYFQLAQTFFRIWTAGCILWICWSWFSPVCCWKQTWEWRFKNRSLLPLLLLLLRLLLISEFFFDSTRIKITEKQTEKSPQKADILMDAEEKSDWLSVLSPSHSIISTSLSPSLLRASLACPYLLQEVGGTISNGSHWITAHDEVLM